MNIVQSTNAIVIKGDQSLILLAISSKLNYHSSSATRVPTGSPTGCVVFSHVSKEHVSLRVRQMLACLARLFLSFKVLTGLNNFIFEQRP